MLNSYSDGLNILKHSLGKPEEKLIADWAIMYKTRNLTPCRDQFVCILLVIRQVRLGREVTITRLTINQIQDNGEGKGQYDTYHSKPLGGTQA
jgi:hypothetical protein